MEIRLFYLQSKNKNSIFGELAKAQAHILKTFQTKFNFQMQKCQ